MNRKERRAAKKTGGPATTRMAATLASAFRAHQSGHRSEAERLYRDVLAIEPRNAAALHLLGALLHQGGQSDEAISLMRQAIAIEPRNEDYHYNLGSALNAADRVPEAIEQLNKAIALKSQYSEAHFELGNAYARAGQIESAEKSLRKALELQPANAGIMNNLGRVLRAMRRSEDAAALWQRAVTLQPDMAIAHFNIGMVRHEQNRLDDAEQSLRRALAIDADHSGAVQELAFVLLEQGRAGEALTLAAQSLAKRESSEMKLTFVRCLLAAPDVRPDSATRDLMRRAVEEAWIRPAELVPLCALVLKANPVLGAAIRRVSEQWGKVPASQLLPSDAESDAAAHEPFLGTLLDAAPNSDIDVERFLTVLRAAMLQQAAAGSAVSDKTLGLHASLARQCFINDYVFVETEDERRKVEALRTSIGNAIRGNEPVAATQLVAFASYRPLHALDGAASLLNRSWPAPVAALLRLQIEEPLQEILFRNDIPALTQSDAEPAEDAHPGPSLRWTTAPSTLQPQSVEDFVRYHLPGVEVPQLDAAAAPDVLIAGCGSGLPAIEAALTYRDAGVLAVDDSADNLAYARRKAKSLNLPAIEFAKADLTNIASIGRSFDVIESSGALHRVADPFAAWSALIALLREGGVMRIALVSETAHGALAAARDFARQGNYQPDAEGIRLFRQNLLRQPADHPAAKASYGTDFFATGTCRDLFFSPHQQPITLLEIQSFLNANGLELLGFETTQEIRQQFTESFPDPRARTDLHAWHAFERQHPELFASMYQLWLRKPRA
jgi:Flp pilus assembly protein TadD/SAM-dependent methyltransferase